MQLAASTSIRGRAWWRELRFQLGLVALGALVLCLWQLQSFRDARQDDPFITYRYGQNFANGDGLVFNPSIRFLGATSPAHMLLASLIYRTFEMELTPTVMAAVGCLAWTVQAIAVFALLVPTLGALGAGIVALIIDLGGAESFKWVPFETNIAMALALTGLLAAQRQRDLLAAVLFAVGTLFRPELALLAALFVCSRLVRQRAIALRATAAFAVVVGGWAAFAVSYYGSALPFSAVQKFQRATRSDYLQHVWTHLGDVLFASSEGGTYSVVAWALFIFGSTTLARECRSLMLLALFTFLHFLTFALVLRPFVEHTWHLYPAVLGSVVFAVAGLARLACCTSSRLARACACLALCCIAVGTTARSLRASDELTDAGWEGARDAVYREVAQFLREYLRPDEEFASVEVGTLAFYSERAAYDLGGLVTDFSTDPMVNHPVRLLVLDKRHLFAAPPLPPIRVFSVGHSSAFVYAMPLYDRERKQYRTDTNAR